MNETEIKVVEYLVKCLRETEDAKKCDNSINCKEHIVMYCAVTGAINAIIKDITTGEYKK